MGIDDAVNKGKDFLDDNKDKIEELLKSEKAEDVSDAALNAGAAFVKKLAPDEHDGKIDDLRTSIDKSVGNQ